MREMTSLSKNNRTDARDKINDQEKETEKSKK